MSGKGGAPVRSIVDIARLAGVSVSTVSRALSGKGTLTRATRDKVRAVAAAHGFHLNQSARNLRMGRTGTIAVLLPDHDRGRSLSDPLVSTMLDLLVDAFARRGCGLLLSGASVTGGDWLAQWAKSGRVDGIIVIGQSDHVALFRSEDGRAAPVVVWGEPDGEGRRVAIGVDNLAGGAMAARHLIAKGRRHLAFFGSVTVPEFAGRYSGFARALPDRLWAMHQHVPAPATPDGAYRAARDYFASHDHPDGIFCATDVIALSVMRAAREAGMEIPHDLSIVGFDDIALAQAAWPPLTTVRQDCARIADMLTESLFALIGGERPQSERLAPQWIERQST